MSEISCDTPLCNRPTSALHRAAPETHLHACLPKYQKKNNSSVCLSVILSHEYKALFNGRGLNTTSASARQNEPFFTLPSMWRRPLLNLL